MEIDTQAYRHTQTNVEVDTHRHTDTHRYRDIYIHTEVYTNIHADASQIHAYRGTYMRKNDTQSDIYKERQTDDQQTHRQTNVEIDTQRDTYGETTTVKHEDRQTADIRENRQSDR